MNKLSKIVLIKKYFSVIMIWRNIFALPLYLLNRKEVKNDISRYSKSIPFNKDGFFSVNYALRYVPVFRSVFRYRTTYKRPYLRIFALFLKKPLPSIEIYGNVGEGLLLFHNMGCVIHPHVTGKNLTVAQGVTIGRGRVNEQGIDSPIIGDNVWICTNAVVFGGIKIGNNVKIGSGTILSKDVPDNCTVAGNPAIIIKRDGVPCKEKL